MKRTSTVSPLRHRASSELRKRSRPSASRHPRTRAAGDPGRLLHELQIHQIELEMQNDELRKTREALEAELTKYSDLYDFAPVGYLTLDHSGVVCEANLAGAGLLGVVRGELLGMRLPTWIGRAERPAFARFLGTVFREPGMHQDVTRLQRRDGRHVEVRMRANVSESGRTCRLALADITEQKAAGEKLRVSEVRYRRLFETAHDGVLLVDPATRKITDANPFMSLLLGYSRDQLIGKELFEIGLLRDEQASREMFRKLKREHQVRYDDLPLESMSGRHQEVEVVANLYRENGHSVIQCNIRDITERRKAEETRRRVEVLAAANRVLEKELVRRRAVEASLKQSREHQRELLRQSGRMQEQLRRLSRQFLRTNEEDRREISRELHDVIAQTLTGISVRLAMLKREAALGTGGLDRNIDITQRLVEKSIDIVHQFARELRPAVLDDLGLIPALHSLLKSFNIRTGIRTQFTAFAGVERLDNARRTALFRVAQEALTNVARHSGASRVRVLMRKGQDTLVLRITDDGRSFPAEAAARGNTGKRLGLLGMRERVEMVGGRFSIHSAPGQGTTIQAEIPFTKARRHGAPSGSKTAPTLQPPPKNHETNHRPAC